MNEIINFLNSHGSVRQFTGESISAEDEKLIVTTAQRSPTSCNFQAYSIISVRGQSKKDRLAELSCNQAHVSECSLFLLFCADLNRMRQLAIERGYEFYGEETDIFIVATVDATLVADRAMMAAQALGYGGVMVGGLRSGIEEVSELVQLPECVYPVVGMSLGKPTKPPQIKPRLPKEAVWFKERYQAERIEGCIADYDIAISEFGSLKGREIDPDGYPDYEGTYSWSEHTARRMADSSPQGRRLHMLSYLQKRGFLKR
jgi:FMN reductase (NADPH)